MYCDYHERERRRELEQHREIDQGKAGMGCGTDNASSPQDLPPLYIITTVVIATHLGQHGSATLVEDTGGNEANCKRLIHLLSTRAWEHLSPTRRMNCFIWHGCSLRHRTRWEYSRNSTEIDPWGSRVNVSPTLDDVSRRFRYLYWLASGVRGST